MIAKIAMFNLNIFQRILFRFSSLCLCSLRGLECVEGAKELLQMLKGRTGSSSFKEDIQAAKIVFAMQAAENTKVDRKASTLETRVGLPSPRN